MKRVFIGMLFGIAVCFFAFIAQEYSGDISVIEQEPDTHQADPLEHADGALACNLPIIAIETDGQEIQKETSIIASLKVIDTNEINHTDDVPSIESDIELKYRGNSSYLTFDKLGYRVTLLADGSKGIGSTRRDEGLLGMASASDWVLQGPFLDRSLVRNRIMYSLSREIMSWAPDTRYCEVIVDGEYQGIYLLIEPVQNTAGRLGLTEFGLISGQTSYVLKRDREGTETNTLDTYGNLNGYTQQEVSILYPNEENITNSQRTWILNDFTEFEKALYGDDFDNPGIGYAAFIDVDSFVEYYLINEFSMISDASILSTFIYKDIGDKLRLAVWDFNNGFDNYPWDIKKIDEFLVADNNWFNRLFQDRAFTDKVCAKWEELRESLLSDQSLINRIDSEFNSLGESVDRNFDVWGYTYTESLLNVHEDGDAVRREPTSPEDAIALLKDTVLSRAHWMDDHLIDLYELSIN